MSPSTLSQKQLDSITRDILDSYDDHGSVEHKTCHVSEQRLPNRAIISDVLDDFFAILFPGFMGHDVIQMVHLKNFVQHRIISTYQQLVPQIETALIYDTKGDHAGAPKRAKDAVVSLLKQIGRIRNVLKTDVRAAYDGDPAAKSFGEIILSYPCIEAITTYRLAHELYKMQIPLIPRLMTERAHSRTGIDIHPGARIGEYFFIDHGTGVVIGETALIGRNVKMYQGVTLGALSFQKDERGRIIKGQRRHPTIKDDVTIYAEATILGGTTVIGEHSIIGGNVWLIASVPAWTRVEVTGQDQRMFQRKKRISK